MTSREFYRAIEKDVLEHTEAINPEHLHLLKGLKVTSFEQALMVFRAILELNVRFHQNSVDIQKQIDEIMSLNGIEEGDLDS
jgi:hypothetical protein